MLGKGEVGMGVGKCGGKEGKIGWQGADSSSLPPIIDARFPENAIGTCAGRLVDSSIS